MPIIDSYPESNQSTGESICYFDGGNTIPAVGQTITGDGSQLKDLRFYLTKGTGNFGGNMHAKVYSMSGTFGTDGVPNVLLATSNTVSGIILESYLTLITFNFSGADIITLENGTYYCIEISADVTPSSTNTLTVGVDGSAPTHAGNGFYKLNDNYISRTYDVIFYADAVEVPPTPTENFNMFGENF